MDTYYIPSLSNVALSAYIEPTVLKYSKKLSDKQITIKG